MRWADHSGMPAARTNHFVLNGSDDLTYRLAQQLSERYRAEVVVLMTEAEQAAARDFTDLDRVALVVAERIDEHALRGVDVATAAGLALAVQDDVGNLSLALLARDVAPRLRLVLRMYHTALGQDIESLLGNARVLSDAEIAGPELVATALGEVAATPVQVARRTLVVAPRADVAPQDVVCGLAGTSAGDGPLVLPGDERAADLVLAEDRGPASLWETSLGLSRLTPKRPSWAGLVLSFLGALFSRKTRIAVTAVLAIIVAAGAALALSLHLRPWPAFYAAATTVLGGPQPESGYQPRQQALQLLLGLAGLAFIPLVTALVVEGTVRARLAVAQLRLIQPRSGHVVVVGLGGVGTRVLRLLHDRGITMVAVAQDENARGVALARELDIPLLIGDPSRETTLRQAGVDRCKALLAVDRSDMANLQTALYARKLQQRVRVVLRLFDPDLADRVRATFDLPLSRSVSNMAVPAFAEALMGREVIGTIAVDRRVLLIAEVFVPVGSPLAGTTTANVDRAEAIRVVAVTEFGEPRPLWKPSPARRVRERDRLTVVATRDGLTELTMRNRRR
ncbi:NAD-binding protein [Catellatospora coxensis]|uniref:Potassium transporter TrkA n=2 Tax=Catellatospora coxensis TaxID=310354 RepID=A0A8J3P962_9ACTN|nr:potassium transporter TrkA [Catellatospora coxensis]